MVLTGVSQTNMSGQRSGISYGVPRSLPRFRVRVNWIWSCLLEAGMSTDFNPLLLVLGLRLDEPSYEPSTESLSSECGIILSQLF